VVKLQSPPHDSTVQFAIVVYDNEEHAAKAIASLNGRQFGGSSLKCVLKLPKGENQPPKHS
jgi:RNA recognition motif-containing protein